MQGIKSLKYARFIMSFPNLDYRNSLRALGGGERYREENMPDFAVDRKSSPLAYHGVRRDSGQPLRPPSTQI